MFKFLTEHNHNRRLAWYLVEYDGEFFGGHPHGYGTWYGEDGTVFKGQFRYGRSNGKAVHIKPNGDKLEGDFLNLRPHGSIVFTDASNVGVKVLQLSGSNDHKGTSNPDGKENDKDASKIDKSTLTSDSVIRGTGKVIRIEGEFRNGMAHGKLKLWYLGKDGNMIKIEGIFRMGQPHGYFTFMNEDDTILTEAKYLNGERLENVYGRPNIKSKPRLFKIPRKIVL